MFNETLSNLDFGCEESSPVFFSDLCNSGDNAATFSTSNAWRKTMFVH